MSGTAAYAGRILVVDDEESITELIASSLRFAGYEVATADSGREALEATRSFTPDLVVLDVMLPDMDGFEVCDRLRRTGDHVPVLFLTARSADADKLQGFRSGGDDYLTKPFGLEELEARIAAILRRSGRFPGVALVAYADIELDEVAHRVHRADSMIELSPTEFRLLHYLLINAERVVSKSQILDEVWDVDQFRDANVVETYVSYLRRKLERHGPRLIHTVRGIGYTLRSEAP